MDETEDGVDDVTRQSKRIADQVSRSAQELAGEVQDSAQEIAVAARDTVQQFIEKQPYMAAAIALGLGWLLGRMHRPL